MVALTVVSWMHSSPSQDAKTKDRQRTGKPALPVVWRETTLPYETSCPIGSTARLSAINVSEDRRNSKGRSVCAVGEVLQSLRHRRHDADRVAGVGNAVGAPDLTSTGFADQPDRAVRKQRV